MRPLVHYSASTPRFFLDLNPRLLYIDTKHTQHRHTNINTMEDFNQPTLERVALLERLQESIGDVLPHFWATCQICDLNALKTFISCGREYPNILSGLTL